jgi:hypothetical protein
MINKLWATKEIYDIVIQAIDAREKSGISRNDTLQMLLDSGDEKLVVIGVRHVDLIFLSHLTNSRLYQFIMGLLIAGARATGTTGMTTSSIVTVLPLNMFPTKHRGWSPFSAAIRNGEKRPNMKLKPFSLLILAPISPLLHTHSLPD